MGLELSQRQRNRLPVSVLLVPQAAVKTAQRPRSKTTSHHGCLTPPEATVQCQLFNMSVEIWPSLPPEQLITAVEQTQVSLCTAAPLVIFCVVLSQGTGRLEMFEPIGDGWVLLPQLPGTRPLTPPPAQRRELEWLLNELHETLQSLKSGLEDCYALLAPVDPGSTLVVSTHRNEIVKGHITRVGTRIVKGVRTLRSGQSPRAYYTY